MVSTPTGASNMEIQSMSSWSRLISKAHKVNSTSALGWSLSASKYLDHGFSAELIGQTLAYAVDSLTPEQQKYFWRYLAHVSKRNISSKLYTHELCSRIQTGITPLWELELA